MISDQNPQNQGDQNSASPQQPVPSQQPTPPTGNPADLNPLDGANGLGDQNPPQDEPEDKTPANFQLGALLPQELKVKIPHNELNFDQNHFLRLLAGSISLNKTEKKKIVETIPKLKQYQVDELIRIFEEEKQKFSQLSAKHVPQLEKLAKAHLQDWLDIETEVAAESKKEDDQAAADEIRKSLGL